MEILLLILRCFLACVFGLAGAAKLFDRDGAERAFAEFGTPEVLRRPMYYLLPAAEISIAVSLLFVGSSWFAAIGALCLLAVFTLGMVFQMAKGNSPDCHCFGQIHSEPVGITSILRNLGFAVLAIILIASGRTAQGFDLVNSNRDVMVFVVGIAVISLLVAVVFFLKKISDQQTEIIRRIELLEVVSQHEGSVERESVTHPHDGLPIGGHFPDFELYDVNANLISSEAIKAQHLPTLFFFVSPTCNPCKAMLPDIDGWRKELLGKVNFLFLSTGKAQENIDKFGNDPLRPVLLQSEREVADAVKAQWTPTAVLMDANGRVASHAAAGDAAIRKLVDQIKNEDLDREFTYFAHDHDHGHAHNKIGETVPEFSLSDINGEVIDSTYFKGKQTLVAFWSLTCPFCTSMMEELKTWNKTKGKDSPDLILFSEGDKVAHQEFGLDSPIILDEGYKTASSFGMFGTPSAVLVNEDGKIVSETAVGAANIWSLVGKR